jgi:hypothetical protein
LLFCSRIEPDAGCCQHSLDIGDVCLSVNGVLWLAHIPRPEGRGFTLASDKKLAEKHKKELVNLAIEKARNAVRKTAESNGCKRSYSS